MTDFYDRRDFKGDNCDLMEMGQDKIGSIEAVEKEAVEAENEDFLQATIAAIQPVDFSGFLQPQSGDDWEVPVVIVEAVEAVETNAQTISGSISTFLP